MKTLRPLGLRTALAALLAGGCLAQPPAPSRLPRVQLDGTWFTRAGKRFIPVGAHWVPAKAAMQWPTRWDPADIEADFAKMRDLGYDLVRFDLLWAWFEPRPGDYNPEAFRQLDTLVALAHKYGIYLHPSLFIGGEVGEAYWDVPWRHGRNPHSDPDMLRFETEHAAELARRYKDETAIIAWDLTDEPPFWIVAGDTTDSMALNWTRLITGALRREDPNHPIVAGTSGEEVGHGPFRADVIAREVDFFSVHPFTIYMNDLFPDPMLSERSTYGAAWEVTLSRGAGKPAMIHEMGGSTAQYAPERVALYDQANLYSGLGAGSAGVDLWCYSDAAPAQWAMAPYVRTAQECLWGMVTWDRQDKPLARAFRDFSRVVAQMDLTGIRPARPDGGILVPYEWSKTHGDQSKFGLTGPASIPYVSTYDNEAVPGKSQREGGADNAWLMGSLLNSFILGRRAGLALDFPREHRDWDRRPLVLAPSPLTSTGGSGFLCHVRSDFYGRARAYVEGGGALYASFAADAAVPDMAPLFGASLVDWNLATDVTLTFKAPLGSLKPGDTLHFSAPGGGSRYWGSLVKVEGGQVIAEDQDGRPALVAHAAGKGRTLLCAYPLETWIASIPGAIDRDEAMTRFYRAIREWAGARPLFSTDAPQVEASTLEGDGRGYVVLVNHGATERTVTVTGTPALHALRHLTPGGPKALALQGASWTQKLGPYEGAVVEYR